MRGQILVNLAENWPRVFAQHRRTLAIQIRRPRVGNSQRALPRQLWSRRAVRDKQGIEAEADEADRQACTLALLASA
jgi:hypothetical protein